MCFHENYVCVQRYHDSWHPFAGECELNYDLVMLIKWVKNYFKIVKVVLKEPSKRGGT